eukprot:3232868-Amphidinium_carterae.1
MAAPLESRTARARTRSPAALRHYQPDQSESSTMLAELQEPFSVLTGECFMQQAGGPVRKRAGELNYFQMNPKLKQLFQESMAKEWTAWMKFHAVDVVKKNKLPSQAILIGTRWIHVDKNASTRQSGQRTPIRPKSRLVVLGHLESGYVRSDAPTASLLSFQLVCHLASTLHWEVTSGDASNAFLQASG